MALNVKEHGVLCYWVDFYKPYLIKNSYVKIDFNETLK